MSAPAAGRWSPAGDKPLRVGLAGLGSMGLNHLRVLSGRSDLRLAAVSDPAPASLDAAVARSGAQGFASPLAMLREADLDAVVIEMEAEFEEVTDDQIEASEEITGIHLRIPLPE